MLDQLLRWFMREPLIAVFAIGLLINVIGSVITAATKAKQRGASRPPASASRPPQSQPARRVDPRPQPQPRPAQPSAEEIAAEMRRILGMEKAAEARSRVEAPPPPAPRQRQRAEASVGDRAPEPLRPSTLGTFQVHVDPKVGASIEQRKAPATGAVGARQLGELGGRQRAGARRPRRSGHLVDLSNLSRAIVLREILDPPVGLRDRRDWH